MATTQLTVKQFAIIALGQGAPPWHLGELLKRYGQKCLPLKSTIANLSSKKAVIYVAMRSASSVAATINEIMGEIWVMAQMAQNAALTTTVTASQEASAQATCLASEESGLDQPDGGSWGALWQDDYSPVQKSDLESLDAILKPAGASIVFLSPYIALPDNMFIPPWVTIGIGGSVAGLANLPGQIFPFHPGQWTSADLKALGALDQGVVVISAGAFFTSAPMLNEYLGYSNETIPVMSDKAVPGLTPKYMMLLTGGTNNG